MSTLSKLYLDIALQDLELARTFEAQGDLQLAAEYRALAKRNADLSDQYFNKELTPSRKVKGGVV